jgi:hypothetical protein
MNLNLGIGTAMEIAKSLTNRFLPPSASESEKMEAQLKIKKMIEDRDRAVMDAQRDIVVAEIQGESWLQRNWRPILMLTVVLIVANNYLIYPYLSLFFSKALILELPERLYSLMEIGVGGYVVGRSVEKGLTIWKNGNGNL